MYGTYWEENLPLDRSRGFSVDQLKETIFTNVSTRFSVVFRAKVVGIFSPEDD